MKTIDTLEISYVSYSSRQENNLGHLSAIHDLKCPQFFYSLKEVVMIPRLHTKAYLLNTTVNSEKIALVLIFAFFCV